VFHQEILLSIVWQDRLQTRTQTPWGMKATTEQLMKHGTLQCCLVVGWLTSWLVQQWTCHQGKLSWLRKNIHHIISPQPLTPTGKALCFNCSYELYVTFIWLIHACVALERTLYCYFCFSSEVNLRLYLFGIFIYEINKSHLYHFSCCTMSAWRNYGKHLWSSYKFEI